MRKGGIAVYTWGIDEDGQLGQWESAQSAPSSPSTLAEEMEQLRLRPPSPPRRGGGGPLSDGALAAARSPPAASSSGLLDSPRRGSLHSPRSAGVPADEVLVPTSPLRGLGVGVLAASCGSRHTLLLTADGGVWSWGWGKRGQLGHATLRSCRKPQRVAALQGRVAIYVSAGGCHSAAILLANDGAAAAAAAAATLALSPPAGSPGGTIGGSNPRGVGGGVVFTWGDGRAGQLGHGGPGAAQQSTPLPIAAPQEPAPDGSLRACFGDANGGDPLSTAVQVSCGGTHTLVLDSEGVVYAFGRGDSGQLGIGRDEGFIIVPSASAVADAAKATTAPAPGEAAAQLLTATSYNVRTPRRLAMSAFAPPLAPSPATAGPGSPQSGGGGGGGKRRPSPRRSSSLASAEVVPWRASSVACGAFHSAAISAAGDVLTWGKEDHGMLGHGHGSMDQWSPRVVDRHELGGGGGGEAAADWRIVGVACGGWHTCAATASGAVYAWGRGEYGRLGLGDDRSRPRPELVASLAPGVHVVQVSAGGTHTLFRDREGNVYACGRGEHGRLGHGDKQTANVPQKIQALNMGGRKALQVSCGGAHSLALIDHDGKPDFTELELPPAERFAAPQDAGAPTEKH